MSQNQVNIQSQTSDSIYTKQFFLLCISSLLFSASFNMLIPELPAYLTAIGGGEYKGLIIALFTITAAVSRPFSGKLTDRIGRVPVMAFGSFVCFVCSLLYPILTSVAGFLLLRLIHGFSTGFKPTATAAYVADIIPQNRWGEAIGMHGIFFSLGMAIGPYLGSTICLYFSIDYLFYTSSLFAILSIAILLNMQETLVNREKFSWSLLKIQKGEVYAKQAIPASVVTLLSYFSFGALITLTPDWSEHLGIKNKGLFFVFYTLSSLLVRFVAGKVSDQYGRTKVVYVGLVILAFSLINIALFQSITGLLIGAALYGISSGVLSPALNAWTIESVPAEIRGKAVATMYIAMEIGIGLGAFIAGSYFANHIDRVPHVLYTCALLSVLAIAYLFKIAKRKH